MTGLATSLTFLGGVAFGLSLDRPSDRVNIGWCVTAVVLVFVGGLLMKGCD